MEKLKIKERHGVTITTWTPITEQNRKVCGQDSHAKGEREREREPWHVCQTLVVSAELSCQRSRLKMQCPQPYFHDLTARVEYQFAELAPGSTLVRWFKVMVPDGLLGMKRRKRGDSTTEMGGEDKDATLLLSLLSHLLRVMEMNREHAASQEGNGNIPTLTGKS